MRELCIRHRAHLLEGGQRTGPVPLAQRTIAQRIKRLDTERALGILAQVVIHQRQRPGIVAVLVNTVGRSVRQRIALDHRHIRFDPALPGKRHIAVHIVIVYVDIPVYFTLFTNLCILSDYCMVLNNGFIPDGSGRCYFCGWVDYILGLIS